MNKFETQLAQSNKQIKAGRAKTLSQKVIFAQEEIIRSFENQKRELNEQLDLLTDLAPDNSLSLSVTKGDFNATEWTEKIHQIKMEQETLSINLRVAKDTYDEWFKDEEGDK